jgi:hypothetical protein
VIVISKRAPHQVSAPHSRIVMRLWRSAAMPAQTAPIARRMPAPAFSAFAPPTAAVAVNANALRTPPITGMAMAKASAPTHVLDHAASRIDRKLLRERSHRRRRNRGGVGRRLANDKCGKAQQGGCGRQSQWFHFYTPSDIPRQREYLPPASRPQHLACNGSWTLRHAERCK